MRSGCGERLCRWTAFRFGDGFGECFFTSTEIILLQTDLPPDPSQVPAAFVIQPEASQMQNYPPKSGNLRVLRRVHFTVRSCCHKSPLSIESVCSLHPLQGKTSAEVTTIRLRKVDFGSGKQKTGFGAHTEFFRQDPPPAHTSGTI